MLVSIYRYNPEKDAAPYMQDYEITIPGDRDVMILDVLALVKEQDSTLAYRRSCREGVCGSDGMNINGKNGLACITPISEATKGKMDKLVLRPLPGLPVIRDLVIDMTLFYKQYEKIKPFLMNDTPAPAIERLQSPEEREAGWPVRVYSLCLLFNGLSVVLVEPRQVRGPVWSVAGLPLPGGQP